jgi:hypothetical protein
MQAVWPALCFGGLLDDALDLAAVNLQFAGYGALSLARAVPVPNRTLQCWRIWCRRRCIVLRLWRRHVFHGVRHIVGAGTAAGADKRHMQLEGANQCHRGPRADQRAYQPVAQAMGQVGTGRGHDACTQAPCRQSWHTFVSPACVEHHHRGGPDQAIHRERQQSGGQAVLARRTRGGQAAHPYEVPDISARPIIDGNPDYL